MRTKTTDYPWPFYPLNAVQDLMDPETYKAVPTVKVLDEGDPENLPILVRYTGGDFDFFVVAMDKEEGLLYGWTRGPQGLEFGPMAVQDLAMLGARPGGARVERDETWKACAFHALPCHC